MIVKMMMGVIMKLMRLETRYDQDDGLILIVVKEVVRLESNHGN